MENGEMCLEWDGRRVGVGVVEEAVLLLSGERGVRRFDGLNLAYYERGIWMLR